MPSADFAAAQERLAARRAQRAEATRLRDAAGTAAHASSRAISRLPFPFNVVGGAGRSVWDAVKGREGTRPEFRVGQVDAELLDEELLELLKGQVGEGLKYFGSHIIDSYTPEILLTLRLILFKLSIWNNNASYGAHLQGLRYTDARSNLSSRPPPKPWQKAAYGIITIGGRYAWTKWEEYLLAANDDYTSTPSPKMALLSRVTELLNNTHDVASLASFLIFLTNGRYRTLTDRLLRLRLTPTSHSTSREVSFEYLNRQLVWHAFTEFLLFLLPLVGISRWRRILSRTWRKLQTSFMTLLGRKSSSTSDDEDTHQAGELSFLPERTCAICYRDQNPATATESEILAQSASGGGGGGVIGSAATDITNPYEAIPCGCVYCFTCLAQRIANEEGEGWTCLRCGEIIKECKPWNGDVLEESQHHHSTTGTGTGKTVGFATDATHPAHPDDEKHHHHHHPLREIDPIPELESLVDAADASSSMSDEARGGLDGSRGLSLGESLVGVESEEWARAGETESSFSDEQSEEYDEDEEVEGEELGFEG
jgi:peroxin-2